MEQDQVHQAEDKDGEGNKSLEDESIVHGKLSDQGHRGIELLLKDKTEVWMLCEINTRQG